MKATYVPICAAPGAQDRSALSPELTASVGARYSRSNEGLEAIMEKVRGMDPDKAVDSIFKMVDYGHASIAGLAPLTIFMDGVSIWLAYYIFSLCPTADGQESSTRYINLSDAGLIDDSLLPTWASAGGMPRQSNLAAELGIGSPKAQVAEWKQKMQQLFEAYDTATKFWEGVAEDCPGAMRIPSSITDPKVVDRLKRNFVFDRARVFLPVAAKTNIMLVMNARGWARLCQFLLAHPLPEANKLGSLIVDELNVACPRMVKHATRKPEVAELLLREFTMLSNASRIMWDKADAKRVGGEVTVETGLTVYKGIMPATMFPIALSGRANRYSPVGDALRMTPVTYSINAIGFAETRDLNRHRPGEKLSPLVPTGFHGAQDQIPGGYPDALAELRARIFEEVHQASKMLHFGYPGYLYYLPLGFQHEFHHTTTSNHFIYMAELRTGTGAHYRYANHVRGWLSEWKEAFPDTAELILEGQAEPE